MSQSDFERILAAMKAARARITHRTPEQVEDDIRRAQLAQLDDPHALETFEEYWDRMIARHGGGFADAVIERYRETGGPEPLAVTAAARELRRFMLPPRPRTRKGAP